MMLKRADETWVAFNNRLMSFSMATITAMPLRWIAWVVGATSRLVGRMIITNATMLVVLAVHRCLVPAAMRDATWVHAGGLDASVHGCARLDCQYRAVGCAHHIPCHALYRHRCALDCGSASAARCWLGPRTSHRSAVVGPSWDNMRPRRAVAVISTALECGKRGMTHRIAPSPVLVSSDPSHERHHGDHSEPTIDVTSAGKPDRSFGLVFAVVFGIVGCWPLVWEPLRCGRWRRRRRSRCWRLGCNVAYAQPGVASGACTGS